MELGEKAATELAMTANATLDHPVLIQHEAATALYAKDPAAFRQHYGEKASGLAQLPSGWRPSFGCLSVKAFDTWRKAGTQGLMALFATSGCDIMSLAADLSGGGLRKLILRSSAVDETLEDRGAYKSIILIEPTDADAVVRYIAEIFEHYRVESSGEIAIILHTHVEHNVIGHLSNEVCFSPTRDRWIFEFHLGSQIGRNGINSRFATPPDATSQIQCSQFQELEMSLRSIGHWVNKNFTKRAHLEWCVSGNILYILQLDFEEKDSDGVDPRIMPAATIDSKSPIVSTGGRLFKRYEPRNETTWKKLNNINDFDVDHSPPRHRLYFARASDLMPSIMSEMNVIADEIAQVTNNRAVLRTDTVCASLPRFNLPRTETLSGSQAAGWLFERLSKYSFDEVNLNNVCFILHQYIPARAAAWAYFRKGTHIVEIDALWGLPDGLQFCPHDSYQVDISTKSVASKKIRYKPHALQEMPDGKWEYIKINRRYSRHSCISDEALVEIALKTVLVSEKIDEDAQIMWFCDIPQEQGLGRHLPWYRSAEKLDRNEVQARQLSTVSVSSQEDIRLHEGRDLRRCLVRLEPKAELIRDETFLELFIDFAVRRNISVELAGSTLGHAYYQLQKAGVKVYCAEPFGKYERVRQRKVFEKLVRDKIPAQIATKGESVVSVQLRPEDMRHALAAKLLEEVIEYVQAPSPEHAAEELADMYEVLRGLINIEGIDVETISGLAEAKRHKRGGFETGLVLVETAVRPKSEKGEPYKIMREVSISDIAGAVVRENIGSLPLMRLIGGGSRAGEKMYFGGEIGVELTFTINGGSLEVKGRRITPDNKPDDQQMIFDF